MRIMTPKRKTVALGLTLLAIGVAGPATAATSRELLRCQKVLESQIRAYGKLTAAKIISCTQRLTDCKLADEIDGVDPTSCLASASDRCAKVPGLLSQVRTKRSASVLLRCGLIPIGELEQFIGGLGFFNVASACSAADATGLVDCLFDDTRCATERMLFDLDPRATDALTTAGVAASFPCVAP